MFFVCCRDACELITVVGLWGFHMRTVGAKDVGRELMGLIKEPHPIDEDIGIVDEGGDVLGVVITREAYEFFLRKVEEEEDRLDRQSIEEFRKSGEKDQ